MRVRESDEGRSSKALRAAAESSPDVQQVFGARTAFPSLKKSAQTEEGVGIGFATL